MENSTVFQVRHRALFNRLVAELNAADVQGTALSCNAHLFELEVWPR